MELLPTSPAGRGDIFDVVLVTGDAYVDHPAFGAPLIGRFLQSLGFRVGILAQPRWQEGGDFLRFGPPRLFFGVTAGNLDSMVANHTPDRRRRDSDAFSPGGEPGRRPDLASVVYAQRCREAFPEVPVVMGGIEASLRRLAHYDFVRQKVRGSVLADAKADFLVYGMGERGVEALARGLAEGRPAEELRRTPGTAVLSSAPPPGARVLPSAEEVARDPEAFLAFHREVTRAALDPAPPVLAQPHGARWVVVNPPAAPLSPGELDALYRLPFTRTAARPAAGSGSGAIPAAETVRDSVVTHRGCYGGCAFCSLTLHQGRQVVSRPEEGILREVEARARGERFSGTISDLGGPTANMYGTGCGKTDDGRPGCSRPSCLSPRPCPHLQSSGEPYRRLLQRAREVRGVRHAFVASGLRHDLLILPGQRELFRELVRHHLSGTMKVAPEHVAERALRAMRKPGRAALEEFLELFRSLQGESGKRGGKAAFVVPYLIAGHPGTTMEDALELSRFVRERLGGAVEQVQQFTPTPMTEATCMAVTGRDPATGEPLHVPSGSEAKAQKALLNLKQRRNREKAEGWFRRQS